jgi:lysophospholipase L1-like esterase
MRLRKVVLTGLVVICSFLVALVGLEIGIRIFRPMRNFAVTVNTWDRELGTRQIPGARGFLICGDYSIDLIINSKGLRDREYPYQKPPGTRRILCLGDSYACGYGVEAEETFAKQLERILNAGAHSGTRWETLNAGVGSTGTAHHLAYFVKEGHRYEPDLVILCFCQANDFWDNATCGLYTVQGDDLIKRDAPLTGSRRIQRLTQWIPGYNSVFAKSHLLNLVKHRVARFHYRRLAEESERDATHSDPKEDEADLRLTCRILASLQEECSKRGSLLILTVIPLPHSEEPLPETERLVQFAEERNIPYVDLLPRFRSEATRGVRGFHPHDLHWDRAGHRWVAEVLYDFLLHNSLLEPRRPVPPS